MNFLNKAHGLELEPIETDYEPRHNENGILFYNIHLTLKYLHKDFTI